MTVKSKISFVIFVKNEEKRIGNVVKNLRSFGTVYVLDGGSDDSTKKIVEEQGGVFVARPQTVWPLIESEEMFEFIKKLVPTSWVFWGYADYILPKDLLLKMKEISEQDKIKYVYIPVLTYLWGYTKYPIILGNYSNFFRKEYMNFKNNPLHRMGKFTGTKDEEYFLPSKDKYSIRHFSLYNMEKFMKAHIVYALVEADIKKSNGKKFSLFYTFGSMANYFRLFYRRGYKAGVVGILSALMYVFFRLMVALRMYEVDNNLDLETMEFEFNKEKQRLLKDVES
jgi:hypothetical protein